MPRKGIALGFVDKRVSDEEGRGQVSITISVWPDTTQVANELRIEFDASDCIQNNTLMSTKYLSKFDAHVTSFLQAFSSLPVHHATHTLVVEVVELCRYVACVRREVCVI